MPGSDYIRVGKYEEPGSGALLLDKHTRFINYAPALGSLV